jgi:dipeptide/tripeptide permease
MIFQILVSRGVERFKAIPSFLFGLFVMALGFIVIGYANISAAALIFLGIFLFAAGEMISSPRIQEYITWIAPKEKAGLYMGMVFLSVMIGGGFSGVIYTTLSGYFTNQGHAEYVWYVLAAHMLLGIVVIMIYTRLAGEIKEREE